MEKYENSSVETNFTGKDVCCEKGLMSATVNSNMLILTVDDVLNTYPAYEAESARKYFEYLKLKEENPTFGYKRLAKMLGVSISRTRCWKQWDGKPTSVLVIKKLTEAKVLPLYSDNSQLPAILRLLGAGFTDGGIDKNLNTFHFNSARMENIEAWKKDFLEVFPYGEETLSAIITGRNKTSIGVRTTDRSIVRFFSALGCPVGNKTMVSYELPNWLFQQPTEIKAAFLDGFFSGEVSVPPVGFCLSLSKILEKEIEHMAFLRQVCEFCRSVGIKHTSIGMVEQKPKRKDGRICDSYRILFSTLPENLLRTYYLIPLTYAVEKKRRFDKFMARHAKKEAAPIKTSSATISTDAINNLPEDKKQESSQAQSLVL